MQPLYAISLDWLREIIPAITNFIEEKAAALIRTLDLAFLYTWITDHALYIVGAILIALLMLGTFKK